MPHCCNVIEPWPAGKPLEPTAFAVHSQHIHAELTGWRTAKGLLLREPVKATFTYTPALAKCGPVLHSLVPTDLARICQWVRHTMISQLAMSMQQIFSVGAVCRRRIWLMCRHCPFLKRLRMGVQVWPGKDRTSLGGCGSC